MRILVTGANGQLGREAVLALQAQERDVQGIDVDELDLAQTDQVADRIAGYKADWVINCAAYTQVDQAEQDSELAFLVNRDSAGEIAQGVRRSGGRMLHMSTDFVFDGGQSHPYSEDDEAKPLGVYGRSKWEGEQRVRSILPNCIVLRTAWVYGIYGHNFVRTILRLAAERDELSIVDDQIGTPTWTMDIVNCMSALIESNAEGLFHFTNEGVASWYDFSVQILRLARQAGISLSATTVQPIPTERFPTPAPRPPYSVLSKKKIRGALNYSIPHWQESLESMLRDLHQSDGP
jgi:dTDP-4-dehydrorhamnose reductase